MGFLDNSRDIIVDAVLTDLGRRRLAEGNFSITRFALGDDEINYSLYDINHPSGSTYYDLDILQSPVFEAFTNNISTMNSRLVTYNQKTLLYLPVIKLNTNGTNNITAVTDGTVKCGIKKTNVSTLTNTFLVSVDEATATNLGSSNTFIRGVNKDHEDYIRVDQGIDNNEMTPTLQIDPTMLEEEYTLEIDNRFGWITYNKQQVVYNFIDDDDVALYNFSSLNTTVPNVKTLSPYNNDAVNTKTNYAVAGARGTTLSFGIFSNPELQNSTNYWFTKLGASLTISGKTYRVIHSTITITGLKTGYSIDIPIAYIKFIS